jgi:hypothetical protein
VSGTAEGPVSTLSRPEAWYDFATIAPRMEKLLREREGAERGERDRGRASPGAGSTGLVSSRARAPVEQRATGSWSAATAGGQTAPRRSKRSEPAVRSSSRRDQRFPLWGEQIEDQLSALA